MLFYCIIHFIYYKTESCVICGRGGSRPHPLTTESPHLLQVEAHKMELTWRPAMPGRWMTALGQACSWSQRRRRRRPTGEAAASRADRRSAAADDRRPSRGRGPWSPPSAPAARRRPAAAASRPWPRRQYCNGSVAGEHRHCPRRRRCLIPRCSLRRKKECRTFATPLSSTCPPPDNHRRVYLPPPYLTLTVTLTKP